VADSARTDRNRAAARTAAPKTGELEKLLARRWEHQEKGNREGFFLADEEIAIFLKKLPPYFERLEENANRLFFESSENIHELETQLQTQRKRLKLTETVLIGIVVLLAGIMVALFLRRMNDANRRLAAAHWRSIVARNENERLRVQEYRHPEYPVMESMPRTWKGA
jgi:hypothetical protein